MNLQPFAPQTVSVTISATGTSSSTPLGGGALGSAGNLAAAGTNVAEVTNAGPGTAFLVFGVGTQVAAIATSYPILAGQTKSVSTGVSDSVGVISASTSTVYVTMGEGV